MPWVDDEVEYVGLDDEDPVSDSSDSKLDDDVEYVGLDDEDPVSGSSDSELDGDVEYIGLEDELVLDDAWGCDNIVHASNLVNPRIKVGITFGDGDTFKKAIEQYSIKGKYEIAAPYPEATRYRAYSKARRVQTGRYMHHNCNTRGRGR